jgi:phosphoribosylanthranilate isomerase
MMVKICGITTLDDALAAVRAGATALGFNFYPKSPRYLSPDAAVEILAALPPGITKVGIFVNESGEDIAKRLGLDVVQLHGAAPAPSNVRVWRAVPAGDLLDDPDAEAFLVDTPSGAQYGGTGKTFDWTILRGARKRVILAGGLDAANVRRAIETVRPWGVDACSRLESRPGIKDHQKMVEFVKAAVAASS